MSKSSKGSNKRIVRMADLVFDYGFGSPNTVRNLVHVGVLPEPFKIGPRAVGWLREDVEMALVAMARGNEVATIA